MNFFGWLDAILDFLYSSIRNVGQNIKIKKKILKGFEKNEKKIIENRRKVKKY